MKILKIVFAVLSLMIANLALAGQKISCEDLVYLDQSYTAKELRAMAGSCNNSDIAKLLYNRAYHTELVSEGKALSNLVQYGTENSNNVVSYQLYIAMVEELSRLWFPQIHERVLFLNKIYERDSEIMELRIHGFDKLADALDEKKRF